MPLDFTKAMGAIQHSADAAAQSAARKGLDISNELVPDLSGELKESGQVTQGDDGQWVASYDTPYAVKQHEDLEYNHPSGQAKFLESALASVQLEDLGDAARENLK